MTYRLLSYRHGRAARAGLLIGQSVYDAEKVCGGAAFASVCRILEDWRKAKPVLARTARRIAEGRSAAKGVPLSRTVLLAPLLYPGEIYCAGANYTDHMAEMARAQGKEPGPDMKALGERPWHFVKSARSSVVGHGAKVKIPAYARKLDWEIELAAVIGQRAKNVTPGKALQYVAGYTIANDLSARDASRRPGNPATSPFHFDWVGQKCFDGACPLGPWIVPAADIPDPQVLAMKLWVNDELMQDSSTDRMIFSTAEQIAMLSSRVTLNPGDLVLTGTPAGVGAGRNRFLAAGDKVRMWIEGIGELAHTMS